MRYMASSQVLSGRCVPWRGVPEVTLNRYRQSRQLNCVGRVDSRRTSSLEQRGQRTPSGQRAASNQARHAASERNLSSRPGSVQSFMITIYWTAPAYQNRVQQGNNSVVGYLDVENGVRKFTVLKSRYPNAFQVGDVIEHFDLKTHFAPIFSGTACYVEESSAVQDEMDRTRRLIEDRLRKLGSTTRGGVMPAEDARRIYNIAKTSRSPEELAQALADVRQYEVVKAPAVA